MSYAIGDLVEFWYDGRIKIGFVQYKSSANYTIKGWTSGDNYIVDIDQVIKICTSPDVLSRLGWYKDKQTENPPDPYKDYDRAMRGI